MSEVRFNFPVESIQAYGEMKLPGEFRACHERMTGPK